MKSSSPPPLTLQERLILQQLIGNNEPINQQTFIGAHNAYNTASDGYLDYNQKLSTTNLLNAGARALELDLAFDKGIHLRHAGWKVLEGSGNYTATLRDVGAWLDKHPNEVIILQYEDNGITSAADHIMDPLRAHLGSRLFTPKDYISHDSHWPSRNEMLAEGKQVILLTQNNPRHYAQPDMEGLAFHGNWNGTFKSDYSTTGRARDFDPTCKQVMHKKTNSFSEVGEDRTYVGTIGGIAEDGANGLISIYNAAKGLTGHPPTAPIRLVAGQITEQSMQDLVRCNVNIIALDMMSFEDGRLEKALWSWAKDNPRPMHADKSYVSLNSDSRWTNEAASQALLAVVCKDLQGNWVVTDTARWKEAEKLCADQGMQFAAPVNGYEQHQLEQKLAGKEAWINAEFTRHPAEASTTLHVNNKLAGDATMIGILPQATAIAPPSPTILGSVWSYAKSLLSPTPETLRTANEQVTGTIMLAAVATHLMKKAFSTEKPDIPASPEFFKKEMGTIRSDFSALKKDLSGMVVRKIDKDAYEFFLEGINDIEKDIHRLSKNGRATITELQQLQEIIADSREGRKDFLPQTYPTICTPQHTAATNKASAAHERISYGSHTERLLAPPTQPKTIDLSR